MSLPQTPASKASQAFDQDQLRQLVQDTLAEAKRQGASEASAQADAAQGLSVTVRLGEVETVEHNRDKGLGVTVYFGRHSGSANTSDFTPAAVRDTVRAACVIAKYTAADPYAGLAEPERLAKAIPELDLFHPWDINVERATARARVCEDAARGTDPRIRNSEGATLSSHQGVDVYGNSHGFLGALASTRHSLSCSVLAQAGAGMQRDYWYTVARDPADLEAPEAVGRQAAERAVRRLGGRKLETRRAPVLFEAPVAGSLLAHLVSAVRGGNLYRRASFLLDQAGKRVFAPFVQVYEQPHLKKGLGSAPFDDEGVATISRDLVREGILQGYVLDSYSGRKLGLATTGNAGGVHNLTLKPGDKDLSGLLKHMDTGLLVTELIGFGVNIVTGDYSRGAAGFWVERGQIQYPVEEITIAGNLRDMFLRFSAVGADVDVRGNLRTGSILIEQMTIAGN